MRNNVKIAIEGPGGAGKVRAQKNYYRTFNYDLEFRAPHWAQKSWKPLEQTTLLKALQEKWSDTIDFHEEPIDEWRNVGGTNLFKKWFENRKLYSFHFQTTVITSVAKVLWVSEYLQWGSFKRTA